MLQNVFFIDDDKPTTIINQRLAKRSKLFNEIKIFNLSESAFSYLKSIKDDVDLLPDLIFLDVNMPAFSGWDFLNKYRELSFPKQIHIIILSTSDLVDITNKEKYEDLIYTYETKPLSIDKIEKHANAVSI